MLTFDSVKSRLDRDQPLSFLEFKPCCCKHMTLLNSISASIVSYSLVSDQWGNIVSGIDLGRRVRQESLFGWTAPLITTASGAKMGKTLRVHLDST